MNSYLHIINKILESGEWLHNRTGMDTKAINGVMFDHDMRTGFPLLTTKKINLKTVLVELEAFIKGITDKRWFQERKCFIWDEWASPVAVSNYSWHGHDIHAVINEVVAKHTAEPSLSQRFIKALDAIHVTTNVSYDDVRKLVQLYECDLGPVYGYQWRNFGGEYGKQAHGVDQLSNLIKTMKTNPTDRRMIVSAWNPTEVMNNTVALPACHWAFEVHSNGTTFDLLWHQRSVDVGAGLPFNIASYAMLMVLLAKETGLIPRYLKGFLGNTHVYADHIEPLRVQIERIPKQLPSVTVDDTTWRGIFEWTCEDYTLTGYDPAAFIKLPIAV